MIKDRVNTVSYTHLEGDLIVVAPEDAHKPRCVAGAPCQVKKVVVKVAV